jgi:hypothetical protein
MRTPEYEPEAQRPRPAAARPEAATAHGSILRWASAVGNASARRVLAPAAVIQRQVAEEEEVEEAEVEEAAAPAEQPIDVETPTAAEPEEEEEEIPDELPE